ncbi:unnamed protein product [Oikopleura dioica]|uniref:SH3 domain-containing protein n=1 Tax=Oikopleura dioica TaxID=34765 RepID=E4WX52_OIKDI|nr:unnamed protein product [Oikopleura dioica]
MNILLTLLFYLIPFGVWLTGKLIGEPILTWIGFGLGLLFTILSYVFAQNKKKEQKNRERDQEAAQQPLQTEPDSSVDNSRAKAKYQSTADSPDELSFEVGQTFYEIRKDPEHEGWYYAKMKDPKTGEEKNGLVAGPFISFY